MRNPRLKRMLFVALCCVCSIQLMGQEQGFQVNGVVLDEFSSPVIGATVLVKGTSAGAVTGVDGQFTVTVPGPSAVLTVSFMGFSPQDVPVGNQREFRITLHGNIEGLDEVIVIGYGSVTRKDLTGASSVVDSKVIEERQPINIYQALQGEVPGLMISNSSGAPGDLGTMLIRGNTTMGSGVNPLYVVDGFIVEDISTINPSDIASMVVNKDAASAAIYGSRSAAGVIIITTKQGSMGKAKVSAKYNFSTQKLAFKLDQANDAMRYIFEQARSGSVGLNLIRTSGDPFHPNSMADNDMQELITRMAPTHQIDLSVSGANEKMNYRTSLSFLDQNGIILASYFKRLTSRTNITYHATDRLRMETQFTVAYTKTNSINTGQVINQAMQRPPGMALYYPDGSFIYNNGGRMNPIADVLERKNIVQRYEANLVQNVIYTIIPGLEWRASVQGNIRLNRTDNLVPGRIVTSGVTDGHNIALFNRKLMGETYLTWARNFGEHNVTAMAGASAEDWLTENFPFYGSNYVSDEIMTSNMQQTKDLTRTVTDYSDHAMASFFGRVTYNYKSRYLVNGTLRYDGSSRFIEKQWGIFPSISGAWRFSDESFMRWAADVLSDGKLRASWGATGNQSVGNYETRNTYSTGTFFDGVLSMVQNSRIANTNLGWETTKQANFGIDLTLFGGRLSAMVDYYIKTTTDLLSDETMALESGVSNIRINYGSLENRGIEVMLSGYPVRTRDFSWQTSANVAINRNKVKKINDGQGGLTNSYYWIEEGQPLGQWYGWRHLGVYEYDESNAYMINSDGTYGERLTPIFRRDPNNHNNLVYSTGGLPEFLYYVDSQGNQYTGNVGKMTVGSTTALGGDLIWEDVNKDGEIGSEDRMILGNAIPKWYGGWTNYFTYKNFMLSFSFYGAFGNQIFNQARRNQLQFNTSNVTPFARDIYTLWRYQGQITSTYTTRGNNADAGMQNRRVMSTFFLEDAAYIKLTNVRLSYRLKGFKALNHTPLDNAIVYTYGSNLMTWTNYKGYDPSSISNSNPLAGGQDNGRYPTMREFGFGIQLDF